MTKDSTKATALREIGLASPDIRMEDIARVEEVLKSGMLTQGKVVLELENIFKLMTGAGHAIAVSSGTAALHIALLANGIGTGDEVIVPAFSFIATANAVVMTGARPVFVDVTPHDLTINAQLIEQALTSRTKAILPVHEFGMCCQMDKIRALADQLNLLVIEDAACALGSRYNGVSAGTIGTCGAFSLHPRKIVTSGEGGMLTCNEEKLANVFRELRNHGLSASACSTEPHFVRVGLNYRLTDVQAAIVIGQCQRLEQALERRRQIAARFQDEILTPILIHPVVQPHTQPNWQTYHVILRDGVKRKKLIQELTKRGIGSNLGAQCIPAQDFYLASHQHDVQAEFPNAWKAWTQGLALPIHAKLSDDDVDRIIYAINNLV